MGLTEHPTAFASRTIAALDSWLHYREVGTGRPIVFLHGNPTSSYLWRNVLPYAAPHGRCLALDLIGMGGSGKPPSTYRLRDHAAYLDAFIGALGLAEITFVLHDWGVALGLDYLTRCPERVRAVALMEGHLHPIARWEDYDEGARALFAALRSEADGRRLLIDENVFIETVLPSGMAHALTTEEWAAYRAPYLEPASREPLWRWVQRSRSRVPLLTWTRSCATTGPRSPRAPCRSCCCTGSRARSSARRRWRGAGRPSAT